MAITKETIVDKIEVVGEFKHIQVRRATVIKEDNESKITVLKSTASNMCCDRIDIVYGGYDITATEDNGREKFLRYKITYQAGPSREPGSHFALYKTKKKWDQKTQKWMIEYENEFVRDFLVDMEFVTTDLNGKIIDPPPTPINSTRNKLYFIDVKKTFENTRAWNKWSVC